VSVYKLPDGRFQARWSDPDKRQRAKIFPTKGEAEDHLAQVRVDMRKGTYTAHRAGTVTLRQFATQRWLPHVRTYRRPNTAGTYASHLDNWVLPKLGHMKLGEIKRVHCQAFVDYLGLMGKPPTTTATIFAVLRGALAFAVETEVLSRNPCAGVKLPEIREPGIDPLPAEAVAALAQAITPRYEAAVWLAAGAGLREGEALGLRTGRIDFLRRRIIVAEQLQGGQPAPLKTKKSRRAFPVDDLVLAKITAHMQRWPAGPGGLLITNRLGRPVQRNSFGHCWREAVKAAGLPAGTRFHDLRHFYASALIGAGLSVKVVQYRLGHATARETLETYAHLWPDDDDAGRGMIEGMFASGGVVKAANDHAR
jgi:integrase